MGRRITIRDIVDLLDYDRTGTRSVWIKNLTADQVDILRTDSYLLQYIEDVPVNAIDVVDKTIRLYVEFEEGKQNETTGSTGKGGSQD